MRIIYFKKINEPRNSLRRHVSAKYRTEETFKTERTKDMCKKISTRD